MTIVKDIVFFRRKKMKNGLVKKIMAVAMAAAMSLGLLAGCGSSSGSSSEAEVTTEVADGVGGTIMWLSNLSSGAQYDAAYAYIEALCKAAGYDFTVVYGDSYNDAAGNLQAVKNGMTDDVVGIITSQDGGIASIMEEYPDVYVAGYNTDMDSVYSDGGDNAALLTNDHYLGTITDTEYTGEAVAQYYFDEVVKFGYKKVAVVNFPSYAYPSHGVAAATFTDLVNDYNETADEPIEIVGDTTTLEFQPLADSWFLEEGHDDLDCIVCICAGTSFVYPTLVNAIANGTCSADTVIVSGGYDSDASITDAIGGTIASLKISPNEDIAYAFVLIDNAVNGCQYSDWTAERLQSADWYIGSAETEAKVLSSSIIGTGNVNDAQVTVDDILQLCVRNNADATYADLVKTITSVSTDDL